MHFNWELSLGNVLSFGVFLCSAVFAWHRWDKRIDVRHVQNQAVSAQTQRELQAIREAVQSTATTQMECQKLITETREKVVKMEGALGTWLKI